MYFYGLGQCAKNALIDIKSVGQEKLLKGVIDSKKNRRMGKLSNC